MTAIAWILAIYALVFAGYWAIDVFRHRKPLTQTEVLELARRRQKDRVLAKFQFTASPIPAEAVEKKTMRSAGEFVDCDLSFGETPARIAGLLKYKKHEWIVVAFVRDDRVRRLWWNKGPDGTKVWLFLRDEALKRAILALRPDAISILHNHPNTYVGILSAINSAPSEADLRSAGLYDREFSRYRISLLEFICDRGIPHLYYASYDEALEPVRPIIDEIQIMNGTGLMKNRILRKELWRRTSADAIAGGVRSQTE